MSTFLTQLGLPPFSEKYVESFCAYLSYFGSRYISADIAVLCGASFDHPIAKTFILFCIMYQASKDVRIAAAMTVFFLGFQFVLSRTKGCVPYADKTGANKIDTSTYFWPKNGDLEPQKQTQSETVTGA